jgi:hypothetical protein
MKLHTISEIQYKETSTNMDRANATGVRAQGSINDLLHKKPIKKKKSKDKDPSNQ